MAQFHWQNCTQSPRLLDIYSHLLHCKSKIAIFYIPPFDTQRALPAAGPQCSWKGSLLGGFHFDTFLRCISSENNRPLSFVAPMAWGSKTPNSSRRGKANSPTSIQGRRGPESQIAPGESGPEPPNSSRGMRPTIPNSPRRMEPSIPK